MTERRMVALTRPGRADVHPNERIIREGYDAFLRGDLEGIAAFLDQDVVWHVAGSSPLAGVYKGQEQLLGLLARLTEMTEGTISISARDILASEDHVIVLTTLTARRSDRTLADDGVAVFRIARGKAAEVWVFAENQDAIDEFFGGGP